MSAPQVTPPAGGGGGGGGISGSGTAGYVAKFTSGTAVGDSLIRDDGTDVSIGSLPSVGYKLTVNGDTTIVGRIDALTGSINTVTSRPSTDLVFQRDTVEAARIIAGGNFGIGTTNPLEKLAVSAGANDRIGLNVSGTVSTLTFGSVGATAAIRTIAYDRTSAAWTFNYGNNPGPLSTALTIDNSGVASFGGPVRATGTAATAPAFTGSDTDTGMYFPANNQVRLSTAGSVAVAVDASQNVGVQNANPSYPLHVGGGNNTGIVTTGPAAYVATNGATSLVVRDATNGIESFLYAGSSVVLAGAASAHSYHIRTNNVSRLIVSATTGIVTVGATAGATADTLDVSTSGWGVKLHSAPNNGNGNTLDCYEEGTWTPVDRSGASLSFTAVSGTYTRIGRTVIAQCTLTYPSTANASDASFSLPIAMTTASTNFGGAPSGSAGARAKNNVTALIKTGATPATDSRIALITYNGAGSVTNANMSLVTIIVSVCYNVA